MQLELNRAERSRLHLSILRGLGVSAEDQQSAADGQKGLRPADAAKKQAFAEAVAWADSGDIADLGTLFSMADAIAFQVDQHVYRSDCQYAEVKADDLREAHGTATVNLALKLAGILPRQRGRKMIWTDAPNDGRTRTVPVTLPADLLEQWNAD